MMTHRRHLCAIAAAALLSLAAVGPAGPARAADRAETELTATAALEKLYAENGAARALGEKAVAMLIFPKITKAGFGVGGEVGRGVLRIGGVSEGHYRTVSLSVGLQVGFQTYGYVLFFMSDDALQGFRAQDGFELGVDGSAVVLDEGASVDIDTTSLKADTVAIVFDESGLMANATIEGSKITRLDD